MDKYYLNKHVKFRLEDDHILVCDCRNLKTYTFPLEVYNNFISLETGDVIDLEHGFYKDLLILNMIDKNLENDNEPEFNDPWPQIKFTDNEFFI